MATKQGLAQAHHRVEMCKRAVESSDWIMVDGWEASKDEYQRTRVRTSTQSHELAFHHAFSLSHTHEWGMAGGVGIL
jgi:nicotinic acid mononucleotide adenylyltransferase